MAPALAAGNTVVLKPSSDAPLIGRKCMEILEEGKLPAGVVNFVTGSGGAASVATSVASAAWPSAPSRRRPASPRRWSSRELELQAGVVREAANKWASHVCQTRDVGSIAGTMPMGVGRLITSFEGDNDGTVAVAETRLEGAKDHICLRVSHTNMLLSSDVVDQAVAFLRRGEFLHDK